ncbi:squalene/phytoene synthase family protein [Jannaschia sp. W003]|uniref:squalene/phytoene synthase family protein n=1 Tax=Jannaschia sp. W003 TaxID=2867012 RepID=UPI0021A61AC0|nr:squalene/phytoene synthase family protein [Jannaschia sp. W003]UWQ22069.1 squalene/phytoene synthase family protein [Jannaschia sp. W003]
MTLAGGMQTGGADAADPWHAAASENFPVASRLLAPRVRPQVVAFYRFARAADDAADDPAAAPEARLARLAALERGLDGEDAGPGAALRRAVGPGAALEEARALLVAFRRDAAGARCADWAALRDYCAHSAAPVGRFLLRVHGEGAGAHALSDALCAALQVLNHVQDIRADWQRLGRRYLPGDWMHAAGAGDAALAASTASPALRAVIDRTLGATGALLREAAPLPRRIRSRGLRAQAAATLFLARRLHARLERGDPLAGRIAPTRLDFARAGLAAAAALP